ncbi:MAG TPA: EutN/CcmL family microcompartment protein [Pirellulales bacterium]|nr:EutN/CcmL family microcompartment protein [Pirellulales bacterium]
MRIGKIIGTVTLNHSHPSLRGATYKLAVPLSLAELTATVEDSVDKVAETVVVYDELGAGQGSLIAISEGGEAAQPFLPAEKPVDAYNAAILDQIDVKPMNSIPK